MTVYVDDAMLSWRGKRWCHLFADSLPELEAFARKIGLKPEWLQNGDGIGRGGQPGLPHYDVAGQFLSAAQREAKMIEAGDGTHRELRRALVRGEYVLAQSGDGGGQ